ncbi:hypothetical protein GHK50_21095 [Sinorhizobium medicae]|uniref:Uncharacterized protein n=1 Tax=Sinorhizobium medicae TaxID=110321 RepID=A0A6G1WUN5_9HYPH|nr:hypothetical protein [Sinorhizobium medicae]MQW73468.1 hypothetical protein [Sinorhizobium medicae]MQX85563.1 hypothetical protein [Sinorhizobium medicae]
MSVSLDTIRELAERLPRTKRECRDRVYHVAHMPEINPVSYRQHDIVASWELRHDRITFTNREVVVDGVRCLASYYHDALVKVCV